MWHGMPTTPEEPLTLWLPDNPTSSASMSRENFEATLNLIDQRYGSLPGYIENQLGFKKEEQQQLRLKYLTTKQDWLYE